MKHFNKLCITVIILVALTTARQCYIARDSIAANRTAYRARADAYYAEHQPPSAPPNRVETALLTLLGRMPEAKAEAVSAPLAFTEQLKEAAKAYGVPRALALGVLGLENGQHCEGTFCLRKEVSYYNNQCARYRNQKEMRDLCASSICQMQVMGFNAKSFGLHPADLFDQTNCIEVSTKMLAACWSSAGKLRSDKERIKAAGRCYNGGNIYSSHPLAVAYGEKLFRSVVRHYDNINLDT